MENEITWERTSLKTEFKPLKDCLKCQLCKDLLKTPMMLTCSHNFCSVCIRRSLQHHNFCPVCREPCVEGDLRKNALLGQVVQMYTSLKSTVLRKVSEVCCDALLCALLGSNHSLAAPEWSYEGSFSDQSHPRGCIDPCQTHQRQIQLQPHERDRSQEALQGDRFERFDGMMAATITGLYPGIPENLMKGDKKHLEKLHKASTYTVLTVHS
eukprot:746733-Hanusia_phi.AAC.1